MIAGFPVTLLLDFCPFSKFEQLRNCATMKQRKSCRQPLFLNFLIIVYLSPGYFMFL